MWPRCDRDGATHAPAKPVSENRRLPPKLVVPRGCNNPVEVMAQGMIDGTVGLATGALSAVGVGLPPVQAAAVHRTPDELRTQVCMMTTDPKWQCPLSFSAVPPDATGVEIELWDWDRCEIELFKAAHFSAMPPLTTGDAAAQAKPSIPLHSFEEDDYLGSLVAPLPARGVTTFAWFPLQWPSSDSSKLQELLLRAGRDPVAGARPPRLGQVLVRLSWGHEALPSSVVAATRPSLRATVGTLRLRVHRARGLVSEGGDRMTSHSLRVRLEGRTVETKPAIGRDPALGDLLTLPISEIVADAPLLLMRGSRVVGEALLPLTECLRGVPIDAKYGSGKGRTWQLGPLWLPMLPPRSASDGPLLAPRQRPRGVPGAVQITATLNLERSLNFCYTAQPVLQGADAATSGPPKKKEATPAMLKAALARLCDAAVAPMACPLRTVCYLQTWGSPLLNVACISALSAVCLVEQVWAVASRVWPFLIAALLPLCGYVSRRIHAADKPFVFIDEQSDALAALRAFEAEREAAAKAYEEAELLAKREAGEVAEAYEAEGPGLDIIKMWRYVVGKITLAEAGVSEAADSLERLQNAFTWEDPAVSRVAVSLYLCLLVLLAAAAAAAEAAAELSPLEARHYAWGIGMLAFAPLSRFTFSALEGLAASLVLYGVPGSHAELLVSGSGLDAARPLAERRAAQTDGKADATLQRRAQAEVKARIVREIALLERRCAQMPAATLWRAPSAFVDNLMSRAPTGERVRHLRIARRLTEARGDADS